MGQSISNERLQGTSWIGDGSNKVPFIVEFGKNQHLLYVDIGGLISKGTWKVRGTMIEIQIQDRSVKFLGRVQGNRMKGIASRKMGVNWEWSATKQPIVRETATPKYPALESVSRIAGNVMIDLSIDASGKVTETRARSGHPLLRKLSEDATKDWKFAPIDKKAVRMARLVFTFRLLSESDEKVTSPVFLSPYRIEVRRGIPSLERNRLHGLRRGHASLIFRLTSSGLRYGTTFGLSVFETLPVELRT